MRRASRDYTKYLRGSEELGSGAAHESAPPPPPPPPPPPLPAHPHSPPASRSLLAALVLLGLGQVVCSVALFLYFRAQGANLPGNQISKNSSQVIDLEEEIENQMDPTRISKEHVHCVRTLFGHQENTDLHDTSFENQEVKLMPESCRSMKQALQRAVQKEVQRVMGRAQPRPEKAAMEALGMDLYKRNKPEKQPFAHLIIDDKNIPSGTRKVNLTSWHHDKGQANLSNMTFNDGKLIVNQDGFYYLYANICFRHHETSGNLTKRGLQLMVYMTKTNLKKSPGLPEPNMLPFQQMLEWVNPHLENQDLRLGDFIQLFKEGIAHSLFLTRQSLADDYCGIPLADPAPST
ncbi:tumor necrosis factor ligand superfamily member 11 [Grus japonensis]|uniref:Tumor necrosis factor ligand superfamily member 11 n=1 Tax=Grus japonensis TaxID=30415 RepID=A0ABC9W394_GRUJA